jgi:hypothetical protein
VVTVATVPDKVKNVSELLDVHRDEASPEVTVKANASSVARVQNSVSRSPVHQKTGHVQLLLTLHAQQGASLELIFESARPDRSEMTQTAVQPVLVDLCPAGTYFATGDCHNCSSGHYAPSPGTVGACLPCEPGR